MSPPRWGGPAVTPLRMLGLLAMLLIVAWTAAAVAMSGRGFDVTDEGFYVLSYRWWDSTPRTFTGVQYLYGPIFELFGYSVPALRLFRLLTVLAAHAAFAWAFVTWLALRLPTLRTVEARVVAGLLIVAAGGVTYGWLPLSPGYNDVAALGSLAVAAAVLRTLRGAEVTGSLPLLPAPAIGPLAVALVAAKWASAGATLLFLALVTTVGVVSTGASGRRRFLLALACSVVGSMAVGDWVVGGYAHVLAPMVDVNRIVSARTNSPGSLLGMYLSSGLRLAAHSLVILVLMAPCGLAGIVVSRRSPRFGAILLAGSAPLALVLVSSFGSGVFRGGAGQIPTYSAALLALAGVSIGLAPMARRREGSRPGAGWSGRSSPADWAVAGMLAGLPMVQALGTGNPLYYLAVNQFACWAALMVAVACAVTLPRYRCLALSVAVCAVTVAGAIGVSGLLDHPYRTDAFTNANARIGGSGPLASLRVSRDQVRSFASLRSVVPVGGPGRPVMAFDEMAGVVLALDGRSVGEAWYSASDHHRTAAGIVAGCRDREVRSPVVIFNREPEESDRRALAGCGLDLTRDFSRRTVPGFGRVLTVYLPNARGSGN